MYIQVLVETKTSKMYNVKFFFIMGFNTVPVLPEEVTAKPSVTGGVGGSSHPHHMEKYCIYSIHLCIS